MERPRFEFVCSQCLATRGVLDADRLPDHCLECGAPDPWVGPFVRVGRFDRDDTERALYSSPFYLGAGAARPLD
jgi:hypothetical protein